MKKMQNKTLRNAILILLFSAVIGIILSVILFFRNNTRTYVTTSMSFTFDGAQDGLAPNGYRFDVNEIGSDEVLSEALTLAGMEGRYTTANIKPCLAVTGVYPDDLITKMTKYNSVTDAASSQALSLTEYHPPVFSVTLYKDFDESITKSELVKLLDSILISYRIYFSETYARKSITTIKQDFLEGYDYFQQLEILKAELEQAQGFAVEMTENEPAFQLNGKSFNDLALQIDTMLTSDLARLNATMTMNSLSKYPERVTEQYRFEIRELQHRVEIQEKLVGNLDVLLSTYGKSGVIYLSTSDAINKVDTMSSRIYDQLADLRTEISDGISALNNQITNYQIKLAEVMDSTTGSGTKTRSSTSRAAANTVKISALETGISRLIDKGNVAIETLAEMTEELNKEEINEASLRYSGLRYRTPSLLSGSFISTAVRTCGPIFMLGVMVVILLIIFKKIKERKSNRQLTNV